MHDADAARNRRVWDRWSTEYLEPGRRNWAASEPRWGIWHIPERDLGALGEVAGLDVLELGCGTAYWSSWLVRRGAQVIALDNSSAQLANARLLQREFGVPFPLVQASGVDVPLRPASFDLVVSEYGACLWCEPSRWVAEAARVLCPGGRLVFLTNGVVLQLCLPLDAPTAGATLARDYFGMGRDGDPVTGAAEFHLGHGEWIRLLGHHGLVVEDLLELRPGPEASSGQWTFVSLPWARRWPSEEIWKARKVGSARA